MSTKRFQVWFERQVLPELEDKVTARVTMLGPASATPANPFSAVGEAEGIVAGAQPYGADVMDRAPRLRVIARTGIGYETVDVEAATARGIAVCNAPAGPTISAAEQAITLMLMVAKNVKKSEAALRNGESNIFAHHVGLELDGKVLGLVGYGRIARHVARIATGIGMRIHAFDPYLDDEAFPAGIRVPTLKDLLSEADVISVHVPMTPENKELFGTDAFTSMKRGAIFVNTSRGGLVDQAALIDSLDGGHLFGAGLDVTVPEPLPADHAFLHRNDVVVTPHVGGGTVEAKRKNFSIAFDQLILLLDGKRPAHLVNPEVLDRRLRKE